jgi:hypothetical protein
VDTPPAEFCAVIRLILGVIMCMAAADADAAAPIWAIVALSVVGLIIAGCGVRALGKQS